MFYISQIDLHPFTPGLLIPPGGPIEYAHDYRDSQWHHLVANKSGIHAELWVDGILRGTNDLAFPTINNAPLLIGFSNSSDGYKRKYWSGKLDDFRLYNRALTKEEIMALFNEQGPVLFAVFTPSASMTFGPKSHDDSFKVSVKFDLGTENNGIDPVSENVDIKMGSFSTTIPAGEFQQQGLGLFTFEGTINKIDLRAHIHMPQSISPTGYLFSLDTTGADLEGTVLPPEVKLTIGDDTGQAQLNGGKAQFGEGIGVLGDVNGDGAVNCNDLKIVKLSFGKKTTQAGFNPSADLNNDGIVDVKELATVSRQLPSGTVCK